MRKASKKSWMAVGILGSALLLAVGCGKADETTAGDQAASSAAVVATVSEEATPAQTAESTEQAAAMVTVTYMDEDTVLNTEELEEGALAQEFIPEKDGSVFIDWFATPSKNHRFDFTQPITADIQVFAGFSVFEEDTREYYILGSGKSDLLVTSDWGKVLTDDMKMTKTEGKNEYTLTCDILKGDQFQFAIDSGWQNKRGFGYIANPNDESGNAVFTGQGGGYGDVAAKGQNIMAALDGNYTFTLYTYPADDVYDTGNSSYTEDSKEVFNMGTYDTITWVRNGDPVNKTDAVTTYYIKGEKITGWEDVYDDTTGTTQDGTKYTLTVTLEEGDVFLFTSRVAVGDTVSTGSEYLRYGNLDEASQALFTPQNPDDPAMANMVAAAAGTYTFVYDSATGVLSVSM
jgi:hypothetical protein